MDTSPEFRDPDQRRARIGMTAVACFSSRRSAFLSLALRSGGFFSCFGGLRCMGLAPCVLDRNRESPPPVAHGQWASARCATGD
jgi:hypothetical protein